MKLVILLFVVFSFCNVNAVGVGITGGNSPDLGLSLGSGNSSNQYSLAVSWQSGIYLHADYRKNFYVLSRNFPLFAGIGGKFESNNTSLGVRVPLGAAMYFSKLELFLEIVPTLMLVPNFNFDTSPPYALGLRYHFKM